MDMLTCDVNTKYYHVGIVTIAENYQYLPKAYQKVNYRKLTVTLSPTLTLKPNPMKTPGSLEMDHSMR